MARYSMKSAGIDEISIEGFGPLTHFEAAEIVRDDGMRCCILLEPLARQERQGSWDEEAWRDAVREVAHDLAYEHEPGDRLSLVWDPARDESDEEYLEG